MIVETQNSKLQNVKQSYTLRKYYDWPQKYAWLEIQVKKYIMQLLDDQST